MNPDNYLNAVCCCIEKVLGSGYKVSPDVDLLVEIDIDSLQTLEMVEAIRREFGLDLLAAPFTIEDLRSPRKISAAIRRHRSDNARAPIDKAPPNPE